jgi:hypothetical protein
MTTRLLPSPVLSYSPALDRTVKMMIVVVVTLVTCMEFVASYAIGVAIFRASRLLLFSASASSAPRGFAGRPSLGILPSGIVGDMSSLESIGMPHAQAVAGSMGILHGRLLIQSTVNAFADTFFYQTMIGVFALILVTFFARGRTLATGFRWIMHMTR